MPWPTSFSTVRAWRWVCLLPPEYKTPVSSSSRSRAVYISSFRCSWAIVCVDFWLRFSNAALTRCACCRSTLESSIADRRRYSLTFSAKITLLIIISHLHMQLIMYTIFSLTAHSECVVTGQMDVFYDTDHWSVSQNTSICQVVKVSWNAPELRSRAHEFVPLAFQGTQTSKIKAECKFQSPQTFTTCKLYYVSCRYIAVFTLFAVYICHGVWHLTTLA